MQGPDKNEKRLSPRLNVPVYIKAFVETFPLGTLINLSDKGMFVQTTEPKEVGTLIDIRFQLPDSNPWIHLKTQVVWVNRPPSFSGDEPFVPASRPVDDNPGMGLSILAIDPESEILLKQFLQDPKGDE